MNAQEERHKIKVNAIARLLALIDGVNKDLDISRQMGNEVLIKQYEYLKKDYTQQLLEILEEYRLPIHFDEAA